MIPKVGRGGSIRGLVGYLAGPGRGDEHENPRVVAGDVALDGRDLPGRVEAIADHLEEPRRAHETSVTVKGRDAHVWHTSLSLPKGEGVLDDEQWRAIAEGFVRRMGFDRDCRWVAVRQGLSKGNKGEPGNDHVHVVVQLVREDGTEANVWNDWHRAQEACAELEREHGLAVVESRELGVGRRGLTRVEWERSDGGRSQTERQYIERAVRGCMVETRDLDGFAARMQRGGLPVNWRVRDGERVGYSVIGRDGIPYQGGKLARDLTLPRLQAYWRTTTPDLSDEARWAAGRLAIASLKRERGMPGPLARESHRLVS